MILECCPGAVLVSWANVNTVSKTAALLSAETVDLYLVTDIDDGSPCLSVESELVVPV